MPEELRRSSLNQSKGSNFWEACFNLTNAFLGVSLLTIPYALSSGGWLSLVLLLVIGIMIFYTAILIKACMELDEDNLVTTYLDIAELAFGKKGRILVSIMMNTELYFYGVACIMVESKNLNKLFPNFMLFNLGGRKTCVLVTALVILPSTLITDTSLLSYVSAFGIFSSFVIMGSIFWVGAFGGIGFHTKGTSLLNFSGLSTAISIYIFCFAGHPVIPSIYTSMRHKYQFSKVLLVTFVLTMMTNLLIAVMSCLMYGDRVEAIITLNLPTDQVVAKVAIYIFLVIPITKYALMVTPIASTIEGGLSVEYKNWRPVRIAIRIVLLISTSLVAFVFPYFENLMEIVASIFVVIASFMLPCICYMKISHCYRKWSYKLMGIIGIIIFGTIAGIVGTLTSILDLVRKYKFS